ncbi:MAG: T9SS type A sorting domain-containing protein [Algicola sp.]|nr:T9SS type A sorting domain-containing protein [Algicola sp.]
MRKITLKLLSVALLLGGLTLTAQQGKTTNMPEPVNGFIRCAADEYNNALLQNNPRMMGSEAYEQLIAPKVAEAKAMMQSNNQRVLQFTIPVVVHVIHNGEPIGTGANISDAQVLSQIQVLNEDFRRIIGTNGFNTDPNGADVEVEFCLAKRDPDGCITNGIDRVDMSSVSTSWGGSGPTSNTNTILKPTTTWDASQYMNMWSVNFSDPTLLGFAQFPGGPAATDGVVSNYTYFGSNDAPGVNIPGAFNLGRTMTHEVGHYLGLYHTFQGGCAGSGDFCNDTPAVDAPNFGCPTTHQSCGTLDMVRNYMDYTDDACMNVFTNDQKARVIATMNTAANRPNTTTSNVCTPLADVSADGSIKLNGLVPGAPCSGDFIPNVRIQNYGTATLTSATITYDVDGLNPMTYSWTGNLATNAFEDFDLPLVNPGSGPHIYTVSISAPNGNTDERACNDIDDLAFDGIDSYSETTEVRLTIVPDNYGSEITWTFSDENGTIASGGPYVDGNTTQVDATFPVVPDMCYTFTINDGFGDGICCDYGIGSYNLRTDDDTIIFQGGEYADSETTQISTVALSVDDFFANGNLYLYPNPAGSQLNIKLGDTNDLPTSYEIVNILGQSITKRTIETNEDLAVNTSSLSNGAYFIKITKDNSSVTLPFIKE